LEPPLHPVALNAFHGAEGGRLLCAGGGSLSSRGRPGQLVELAAAVGDVVGTGWIERPLDLERPPQKRFGLCGPAGPPDQRTQVVTSTV
jgi:hypothetical protein